MSYCVSIYAVYAEEAHIEIHPEFIEVLQEVFWSPRREHCCDDSCWGIEDELEKKYGKFDWFWD